MDLLSPSLSFPFERNYSLKDYLFEMQKGIGIIDSLREEPDSPYRLAYKKIIHRALACLRRDRLKTFKTMSDKEMVEFDYQYGELREDYRLFFGKNPNGNSRFRRSA